MLEQVIQQHNEMMCDELSGYLEESFGNPTRIDYGTGHETTFMIFLCDCPFVAFICSLHVQDRFD